MRSNAIRPRPLEVAAGSLIGEHLDAPVLPSSKGLDPVSALQEAMLDALDRPPCLVAFSGGRDSSALLAVATDVARRSARPLPVPVTWVCPDAPSAHEDDWQQLVIRHLGLDDWHRVEIHDELDAVGPVATKALRLHGLVSPANAYMMLPLMELARGGTFVTGVGGDELLGGATWRATRVLARQVPPRPSDLLRLAFAAAPRTVRGYAWRLAHPSSPLPWLKPEAATLVSRTLDRLEGETPLRWASSVNKWWRSRQVQAVRQVLQLLGGDLDVRVVHPFIDPAVVVEFMRAGGLAGWGNRTAAMERFFGGLLPPPIVQRATKAHFSEVVWGRTTRAFAESWDGRGVDEELVDVEALRSLWIAQRPGYRTLFLQHSAWLAGEDCRSDPGDGV